MPISAIDGCDEAHWTDVYKILNDAAEMAGFAANIVSNSDDVGVIQKRIIQNLYENEIVLCDVSGKNPNVMFELGIRLAFDKPTVIVKDDKTSYSFDTSPIEHISYPRDLRFSKIVDFKDKLCLKLKATNEKAKGNKDFSPFLKHFGDFKVAKLDTKEVPAQDFIIEELRTLRLSIERLDKRPVPHNPDSEDGIIFIELGKKVTDDDEEQLIVDVIISTCKVKSIKFINDGLDKTIVAVNIGPSSVNVRANSHRKILNAIRSVKLDSKKD